MTPTPEQRQALRDAEPGVVLFWENGPRSYQVFDKDVAVVAPLLGMPADEGGIVLGKGVAWDLIRELVADGHRVAVVEQVAEKKKGKSVDRVVTPGVVD